MKLPDNPLEALAILEAFEEKRKKENFIKYWKATPAETPLFAEFTADIKLFGILGGNRSGKTEMGAFIAVAWALGKKFFEGESAWEYVQHLPIPEKANNIWVVGLDFPTLRDVIWREKLRTGRNHPPLLPKSDEIVVKISDSDYQIFFANGSVITGKSADSGRDKFQGASVDLAWLDEECDVEIFEETYQRTLDCAGKVLLTLTPLKDHSSGMSTPWVFDLYEESKKGTAKDIRFVSLSFLDNPYIPEEEKTRAKQKWAGHPEEKARLYGEFISRSGLVYPQWDKSKHVVPWSKFPFKHIPEHWRRVVSIDPAATGTTAAVFLAFEPGSDDMYLYRTYYSSNLVVSEHAKNILIKAQGDKIDVWLLDPKWGAQRNAENHKQNIQLYREAGIPCRLAAPGDDYGMNESREYIQATLNKSSRHPKFFAVDDPTNEPFFYEMTHYV